MKRMCFVGSTKKNVARKAHSFFMGFIFLIGSHFSSKACSPLNVPTLLSSTVTATSLLLDWQSTNIYYCPDAIDVEISVLGGPFSGLGAYTFTSATVTGSATPYNYPTQSINISNLCQGSVYQFRARERNNPGTTSGLWTMTYTFTTLGTYTAPVVSVVANPSVICAPGNATLSVNVTNACGVAPYSYTWTGVAGVTCSNCASPLTTPSVTSIYTVDVKGGQLGCWSSLSNTLQLVVTNCTGIEQLDSSELSSIGVSPNPNTGKFFVRGNVKGEFELSVYNSIGEQIYHLDKARVSDYIDLNYYAKGIFNVVVKKDGGYRSLKLVVE